MWTEWTFVSARIRARGWFLRDKQRSILKKKLHNSVHSSHSIRPNRLSWSMPNPLYMRLNGCGGAARNHRVSNTNRVSCGKLTNALSHCVPSCRYGKKKIRRKNIISEKFHWWFYCSTIALYDSANVFIRNVGIFETIAQRMKREWLLKWWNRKNSDRLAEKKKCDTHIALCHLDKERGTRSVWLFPLYLTYYNTYAFLWSTESIWWP